jgi:DNA-binding transcriptional regulator of glucitol operon
MMDKRVWLSPRALKLHAVILVVVPACMALCVWQISRALDGNSLSWAYVFEWPLFAGYAIYMWWRFVHEKPEAAEAAGAAVSENGHGDGAPQARPRPRAAKAAQEDAELAAYNDYLARLAENDRARGR